MNRLQFTVKKGRVQAVAEAEKIPIDDLNGKSYSLRHTDAAGSLRLAMQALQRSTAEGYSKGIAEALLNKGFHEMNNDSYDKAFSTFHESLRLLKSFNYPAGLARAKYNLGVLYQRLGDYESAMEEQGESLRIRKSLGDEDSVASSQLQIAYINLQFGLHELALQESNECIAIWKGNGNDAGLAGALIVRGLLHTKSNEFTKAKECLVESYNIRKRLNEVAGQFGSLGYLADVLLKEGNAKEALKILTEALASALEQAQPFSAGICRLRTNIARVYTQLKDNVNASRQLESALELAKATKQQYQIPEIYFELSTLYKSLGNYNKALMYYEHFHESKQSVLTLNAAAKVKNLEVLNRVELREKEIEIHRLRNLELKQRNRIIKEERKKSEDLLLNILPKQVAGELKKNGATKTRQYKLVSVIFIDFVNFTATAETLSAKALVDKIHTHFSAFDEIITRNHIEKIKTIGDAYMAAGGVPQANESNPIEVVSAALEILAYIRKQDDPLFQVRIGIHSGPVIAGIVGNKKFAYDIWGDTVNIASRMQSSGEQGRVNVSGEAHALIRDHFPCTYRGKIPAKRKGMIDMYFVDEVNAQTPLALHHTRNPALKAS